MTQPCRITDAPPGRPQVPSPGGERVRRPAHSREVALFILLFAPALLAADPDFSGKVAPILARYCNGCHNADDAEGRLVLESFQGLQAGGKRGPVVVPGKSSESRLVLVLEGKAKPKMPPKDNPPPTKTEIALLKAWIDAGALGPSSTEETSRKTLLVVPRILPTTKPRFPLHAIAFRPDGKLLAAAQYRTIHLFHPETRTLDRDLSGHAGSVNAIVFSADGKLLLGAGGQPGDFGEIRAWDADSGRLRYVAEGHADSAYAIALSPNGSIIATGGYDQRILLWEAATGRKLQEIKGHNGAVFDLSFRPDGKVFASASADRTVKLWNVESGARLETLSQSTKEVHAVVFSPDGRRLAAGGVDHRIRVWEISASAAEGTNSLVHSRFAHEGSILDLVFSADGQQVASSSSARDVKLWNADDLVERHLLEAQPDWPSALAFSPGGKTLAVGRLDGSLGFYDTLLGAEVRLSKNMGTSLLYAFLLGALEEESPEEESTEEKKGPPKPELSRPEPRGLERGHTTRVKLVGNNLKDISQVQVSDARLSVELLADADASGDALWIEVATRADLPPGGYELWVEGKEGASGRVKVFVDTLRQVVAATAELPASFWGTIHPKGDADLFSFEATRGTTLVLDLAANRLGSKLDGLLTLLDPAGHVIASSNDFDGTPDPFIAAVVPADGVYSARVTDLALDHSEDHFYRLSVGTFPFVTGLYPLAIYGGSGRPESKIELIGYNLPPGASVEARASDSEEVEIHLDPATFRTRRPLKVAVSGDPGVLEAEPNDHPSQATLFIVPGTACGRIGSAAGGDTARAPTADTDLFRFETKAGETWVFETEAARRGSPVDTKIEVLDASGAPIEKVLLQATRDSRMFWRPLDSQEFETRISNWEEMELNQYVYIQGEVVKLHALPNQPDADVKFYVSPENHRRCFFDTTATAHAVNEVVYVVEPHPPGTKLVSTGLPELILHCSNDDDAERRLGHDSRLTFTATAGGTYLVRVSDVRGHGGERYVYRLIARRPQPDFEITLKGTNPTVHAGSGKGISLTAVRKDGFEGEIRVDIEGLPPGFSVSTPIVIEAGQHEAKSALFAAPDAPEPTEENGSATKVTASAVVDGKVVTRFAGDLGRIRLAAKPQLVVRLEPMDASQPAIVIAPGSDVQAILRIERNGFEKRVFLDVENLPFGVRVDNIGLNGVLIPEKQHERQILLTAAPWVAEMERHCHAASRLDTQLAQNPAHGQTSPPVSLRVVKQPRALR